MSHSDVLDQRHATRHEDVKRKRDVGFKPDVGFAMSEEDARPMTGIINGVLLGAGFLLAVLVVVSIA
jgi:hypothetical protein